MLPQFYNGADVGAWPGAHTISALEAVSTGLPCVLPFEERAYTTLHENRACAGFIRGDAGSLADTILKLLGDTALRTRMAARGRALAEKQLSWETIARRTLELYSKVPEPGRR